MKLSELQAIYGFQEERQNTIDTLLQGYSFLVFEFNIVKGQDKRFFFVEGITDKDFYMMAMPELRKARFFNPERVDDAEEVGKKAVIQSLIQISRKSEFSKARQKCTFIIDRDYDPDLLMTGYDLCDDEKARVAITKGHSVENYLMYDDNWICFANTLKEMHPEISPRLDDLRDDLSKYLRKYARFFIKKAAIVHAMSVMKKPQYKNGASHDDIFLYSFPDNIINERLFNNEIQRMDRYIYDNDLEEVETTYKKTIMADPALYIRGHDIYDFIRGYLLYNCKVNIGQFPNEVIMYNLQGSIKIEWDRIG